MVGASLCPPAAPTPAPAFAPAPPYKRFILREEKKLIGQYTRLKENEDLPIWEAQASRQKPPCFYVRALITREIVHRKDAQCNTKEWP